MMMMMMSGGGCQGDGCCAIDARASARVYRLD